MPACMQSHGMVKADSAGPSFLGQPDLFLGILALLGNVESCEGSTWPFGARRPGKPCVNADGTLEVIAALLDQPDSPTASCGITRKLLADRCRRITEAEARKIHPSLFAWLDSFEEEDEKVEASG